MTLTPIKKTYPLVDRWSFASPTQSISQKHLNIIFLHLRHNLKSKVPFKYLMMRFTAIQCGGRALDMNSLTVLTANEISALVATIAYIRDPTMDLYGTLSISLYTFIYSSSESTNNFELISNEVLTGLHYSMLNRLGTSSM